MLYILLFIFVLIFIISVINDSDIAMPAFFFTIVTTIVLIGVGVSYNNVKSTAVLKLEVLNEQNEIVLAQIEPLVQQALNYESNTYKEFKLTPENIVAFGNMYPQLQANSFIQSQINIIVENQKEIKDLKLKIASLNAYRLWLFTKKE
jgi:hypothetical protein